ncbi:MAG TPA: glycosyl hydrolase [Gemmatimonadaceae bacterium]|nr:glycosyl hydrolase [Gemmatimonadaceae bacterium]
MPALRSLLALTAAVLLGVPAVPQSAAAQAPALAPVTLDSALLAHYTWRNVGPDRGGRSIAASGVVGQPNVAYFGATGGGLWKTVDTGETWFPVTDGQVRSASVGAVAVSETNPDLVFIGMGETAIRGNIIPGDGVYRSTDAGKTWEHVGFGESHGIAKIRIHPTNPDIIFVASFGKYSAPSEERGVFKSTDGGDTWKRVLFRDARSGAIDIAIDRTNPSVMYAALWEAYRKEYQMSSGGPGSGLFKSTDGGETWTEITRNKGLPSGLVGRIGVALTAAQPGRVYALIENENGGLFKSDDAGATWELMNDDRSIRQRAFYYTNVFADHQNADVVYAQNVTLFRSADAGKTLESIDDGTHGDHHDLWIDPANPAHLVDANDGGGAITLNTGETWTEQDFPTAQFYHAITTSHIPYHICGSQQDNTTLCVPFDWNLGAARFAARGGQGAAGGPSGDARPGGPGAGYRDPASGGMAVAYRAGGGEPGYIAPDPLNPDLFYSGTNNGRYLDKYNRNTGLSREVNPYPWFYSGEPSSEIRERWQWTYPIIFSKADPTRLYVSSQRLWMTTNAGRDWTALSGDLTRHDPKTLGHSGGPITGDMNGPEVYATIFAVGPGKLDVNVIWTGSDDGLVHVTRDGGKTWTNVTPPGMPDFGRVSQIDASSFDSGTAYVSVRKPLLDDFSPYIFRTRDFGRTWTKIVDGIRADDYVHAVREDPTRRGLLYAAAQHGTYISYDDGAHWQSLQLNMPDVPVVDLIVERNELVIATHGRGFWVLDNIAPLRQATPTVMAAATHLYTPVAAIRSGAPATITWKADKAPTKLSLEVLDSTGAVLRSFESAPPSAAGATPRRGGGRRGGGPTYLPLEAGLTNFSWDLRTEPIVGFDGMILWGARLTGPVVPPGRYTLRLVADGKAMTAPLDVERNPFLPDVSVADLHAQYQFGRMVRDEATKANQAVIDIRRVKAQLENRLERSDDRRLKARGATLEKNASAVEQDIYQVKNQSGQDPLNFPIKVNNRLANLLSMSERGDGRPTTNMPEIFGILKDELKVHTDRLAEVWKRDLLAVNNELARLQLPPLDPKCATVEGCAPTP